MATTLSSSEIETRRPVWSALSELFLDTTLTSRDLDRIATVLARSPYAPEELDRVLLWEVYPACRSNLWLVAGESAGFDPEWLESRILRGQSALGILWTGTVGRLGTLSSIHWRKIRRRIAAIREGRRWRDDR
jgi:hypothetical protein